MKNFLGWLLLAICAALCADASPGKFSPPPGQLEGAIPFLAGPFGSISLRIFTRPIWDDLFLLQAY